MGSKIFNKKIKMPALFEVGKRSYFIFWWGLFILLSFAILSTTIGSSQVSLSAGEIAPEDIYYDGSAMTYTSDLRTEDARNKAAESVEQIYKVDEQVLKDVESYIDGAFNDIIKYAQDESISTDEKLSLLKPKYPGSYSDSALSYLLEKDNADLMLYRNELKSVINSYMQNGVTSEEFSDIITKINDSIASFVINEDEAQFLQALITDSGLSANKEYDAVATAAELNRVVGMVEPVQVTVKPGELIVSKGASVTAVQVEALQSLGMLSDGYRVWVYLGMLLFVGVIYYLLILYLHYYKPKTRGRETNIVVLGFIINLALLICKLISMVVISNQSEIAALIGFLLPVAAASMLLAILVGRGLALFVTVLLGICIGIVMNGQMIFGAVAIIGGTVGVFRTNALNQRNQLVGASIYIALFNVATIASWGLLTGKPLSYISIGAMLGLLNGILASVLTIGFLPFFESAFGITTTVKLLELSNANHPLLKRLMMEAPGTYHHSILVGNLAEAAAGDIDADPLLVRVASYYHDVGKLKRPYFFIENQMNEANPHDKLQPSLSTLIITSHLKDGVEMLKQAKIPDEIIDIVEQHHGTGILPYFYHRALELADDPDSVRESDYRYPGPRPQTREAALVLLADSVQAAVQSMTNPNKDRIEQKVREIIDQKADDGQLQDCHLTFRDLESITNAFTHVLIGIHHNRIVYPEQVAKEIGGLNNAGILNPAKPAKNSNGGQGTKNHAAENSQTDLGESSSPENQ